MAGDECLSRQEWDVSIYTNIRFLPPPFSAVNTGLQDDCIDFGEASAFNVNLTLTQFIAHDTNNNTCIDRDQEFDQFVQVLIPMYSSFDDNQNGCIDQTEAENRGLPSELFRLFDFEMLNNCIDEGREFDWAFGYGLGRQDPPYTFDMKDSDQDGCVSFDEYYFGLYNYWNLATPLGCNFESPVAGRSTCDESMWPDVFQGLVCGECTVLVDRMSSHYMTCSGYCAAINRTCERAWEEEEGTCRNLHDEHCETQISSNSAICKCSAGTITPVVPEPPRILQGLMALNGEPCEQEGVCPEYLQRLNKCLCESCCSDVNFALSTALATLSGVPACVESATCAASALARKLDIEGITVDDFAKDGNAMRRKSVAAFRELLLDILKIDLSTTSLVMGEPEPHAKPNSCLMELKLSCSSSAICDEVWSRKHEEICSGSLAEEMTILFGKNITLGEWIY